jgi:hypothetical protein
MNHWHTVGWIADDHRTDLGREAARDARVKLARGAAEPGPGARDPNYGGHRRWLVSFGASIQGRLARHRAVPGRQ